MPPHRVYDPALAWLYKQMKAEQKNLPESERVGFDAWLRAQGILNPTAQDTFEHFEVPLSEVGYDNGDDE